MNSAGNHDPPSNSSSSSSSNSSSNEANVHLFTPVVLSILVTETAERFAYFGFRAVLVLYFTTNLFLDDDSAVSFFAFSTCLANFSPILGATLADGTWGRFHTILYFGCIYAVGLMILTYAAYMEISIDVQDLYKPNAVDDSLATLTWKRALTCFGLILVCTGTGGIKPCVNIFGADQVALRDQGTAEADPNTTDRNISPPSDNNHRTLITEEEEEEIIGRTATTKTALAIQDEDHAVRQFFAFFYACINLGALTSYAVIPIVKKHYGFGTAFLLPTIFMCFAISTFYSRRKQYYYRQSEEGEHATSLLTTVRLCWQLIWGKTAQKLHSNRTGVRHHLLPQNTDYEQEQELVEQHRREQFEDEDLADVDNSLSFASPKGSPSDQDQIPQNNQALEDAQHALKILPIMAMLPMYWMLYDQQGSVWTLQASRMALHGLQPEQLNILNPLEIMLFIPLFDRIIYPYLESRNWNIAPLRRMGWGMVLTSLSFVVSGILETAIENSSSEYNPEDGIHVLWQIPQITIISIGEVSDAVLVSSHPSLVAHHAGWLARSMNLILYQIFILILFSDFLKCYWARVCLFAVSRSTKGFYHGNVFAYYSYR